jgi:hypothetical protein
VEFIKKYREFIYKNNGGFLPVTPLGRTVKLGDLLRLPKGHKGDIDYRGVFDDAHVKIKGYHDPSTHDNSWRASSGVVTTFKAAGAAPVAGSALGSVEAGIRIEFTKDDQILLEPRGLRYHRIENLMDVRKALLAHAEGVPAQYRGVCLVTEIAVVESYALAISVSKGALLEVAATAGASALTLSDLSRVDLGLVQRKESNLGFRAVGAEGGALFFKAEVIDQRSRFSDKAAADKLDADGDALVLRQVDLSDFD